jgi:UDP-glucose:(heptosyl)LPS alpha-1,3-glucosyltransferase
MKLALLRRHFSATGGAELYSQRLLTALLAAGHEVHLFAEHWQGHAPGVQLHTLHTSGSRSQRAWSFARAAEAALAQQSFDCVFSLERTLRQDVYRAGDGLHRVWLERRRQFAPWWRRWLIGRGAFHRQMMALETHTFDPQRTRHLIVNSEMVRREIQQHFPTFPAERIHLVRNGVELPRFQNTSREAARRRFGLRESDFVLLFVGSGWHRKGLPWLLDYMRTPAASQMKLLAVTRDRIRGTLPPNVILTGPLSEVEQAYAAADVLVFLPIYEPCSNVVSEALATGIPAITTMMNGASELIQPGLNGHILPDPRDFTALTTALTHWQQNRHRPVTTTAHLDLETNVRETLRVLELAAKSRLA